MAGHYNQYISGLTLTGIIILLLGCHERTKVQSSERIITDPYHQSFWGKGIEMMIKEDSTDTTFFDKAGNMIRSSSRFGSSQARFDESHRLVRMIRHDDTSGNYLYKYDTAVNVIMQLGNKILSTNWDYDSTDVDRTIPFRILYVFDEKNRMINEINARDGYFLFHRYDDALRRESLRYEHTTKMVTERTLFFYDGPNLQRIEGYEFDDLDKHPAIIHFFNGGRLDSTQHFDAVGSVLWTDHYRFVYY